MVEFIICVQSVLEGMLVCQSTMQASKSRVLPLHDLQWMRWRAQRGQSHIEQANNQQLIPLILPADVVPGSGTC